MVILLSRNISLRHFATFIETMLQFNDSIMMSFTNNDYSNYLTDSKSSNTQ